MQLCDYVFIAMKPTEITEALGLDRITDRAWWVQPSCATSGDGLYQGLTWLSSHQSKWWSDASVRACVRVEVRVCWVRVSECWLSAVRAKQDRVSLNSCILQLFRVPVEQCNESVLIFLLLSLSLLCFPTIRATPTVSRILRMNNASITSSSNTTLVGVTFLVIQTSEYFENNNNHFPWTNLAQSGVICDGSFTVFFQYQQYDQCHTF